MRSWLVQLSAIPGYVVSFVASDSPDPYDAFYAFYSQQNIPAIAPGRMKGQSEQITYPVTLKVKGN